MKYPTCTLSGVISPGIYNVVSTDKEHVSEVLELERNLKRELSHENTPEFNLSNQMCVAVTQPDDKFQRGVIEEKLDDDLYQVLLMDYGHVVHERKSKLRVITNKAFMNVEPLSFTVKLYGLIPAKYVFVGTARKPKACKEWTPESKEFVSNLLRENREVVVKSILIRQRIVYGDLFVRHKTKFVSLRKLLCKNEFCVYSESRFLTQEHLESSSDSSELDRKMELVEKWQKENFGIEFQESPVHSPPSVSSSISNVIHNTSPSLSACESDDETHKVSDLKGEKTTGEPKTLGVGRGKIKWLIAEMRKKKGDLGTESSFLGSVLTESTDELEHKGPLGRGQFLKKYLELKKSLKSGTPVSPSPSAVKKVSQERKPPSWKDTGGSVRQSGSPMQRAVVKPGEVSELSDSCDLTEISLSTEDDLPPLVRDVAFEKKFSRTVVNGDERVGTREELNKSSSEIVAESARELRGTEEKSGSAGNLGSSKVRERQLSVWQQKVVSSVWTPYVRFDDSVVEPVKTFRELPIQPSVIKNLEKGGAFSWLSQVQQWAIPAIRKQLNTIVIGSSKTGKTVSYVVPLMDYVQDDAYFDELPEGNGPSVVILASSSRICESIYYLCHTLLGHHSMYDAEKSKVKIVLAHGNGCEENLWVTLTNGCDVLISTPHCLVRLLEMPVVTNLERLTCLVLDEVDIITDHPFRKNTRIILEKAQFSTKSRYYQKILCGEKWTPNVENLVKTYVESYALVIGSYSEAAIYEGLKPSIYLVDQNQKPEVLLGKIENGIGKSKILIVCEGIPEVVSLCRFLKGKGIFALLAHENIMADGLKDVRSAWKSSRESVLVATDGVLNELNVREAQTLVHYSLPSLSKTNFYLRYFTFENFLRDKQRFSKTEDESLRKKLQDIILIDDENHYQLPHIVEFVQRLGGKIPEKILHRCHEIRRVVEVEKCNSPICDNILAFGRCRNSKSCRQRHAFVQKWDSRGNLPSGGWVTVVVLKTHDASCFSARPVEYTESNGKTSKPDDSYLELPSRLAEVYKEESSRRAHGVPKVGDVCAVKEEGPQEAEVFHRAKVLQYLKVDKYEKPVEVKVKLMDKGDVWNRKTIELYELPEDLSKLPPTAVDVRLVGLQPMDFDVSWSEVANDFSDKLLTQDLEENQYWSGKIVLALNNTLFVDPLRRKQFLPQLNLHVFDLVVRDELLNHRIAVDNPEHLPSLLDLCSEGGLDIPGTEEVKKEDSWTVQPQWAFLDTSFDIIPVRFLAAESTSTVFLQNRKFEKLLRDLEEDCQKEGEKALGEVKAGKGKKLSSAAKAVGMFCLALFEDGKWNRGRIESEKENEYEVYFVDHGDFHFVAKGDVVPIPESLLLRLPCQAIECKLAGTKEEDTCPVEVLEKMYAFSEDGEAELYAKVARKDLKANVTGGRKYSLNLTDKRGVSLNKMLVESEMVPAEESEREHLKDVEMEEYDGDDEEEDEDKDDEGIDEGVREEDGSEEESPDVTFSEDYTVNLTEDLFEDEIAQNFLKEFASKVFKMPGASQGNPQEGGRGNMKALPPADTPPAAAADKERKGGRPVQKVKELLELHRKRKNKGRREVELKGRNLLTPQVQWCQNQMEIQIKILLANVSDYSLQCTLRNLSFRCFLGDKFYGMDLRLYGAVNPELTKVTVKAFHVVVVLTKLAFPLWPRLHVDEGRFRWINLDVESLADKDNIFSEKIRSAKLEIESGALKKGIRSKTIQPCSDSEDSDTCQKSSESEDSEDES